MKSNGSGPDWRARRLDERLPAAGASLHAVQLDRVHALMPHELVMFSRRRAYHEHASMSPDQAVANEKTAVRFAETFAKMTDDEVRVVATNICIADEKWWHVHRAELIATGKVCNEMGCRTLRRDEAFT